MRFNLSILVFFQFVLINCLFLEARMSGDEAIKRLLEGNRRYFTDQLEHPDMTSVRREEVAFKQSPFAVIVGCSDSRVPPEIIFDQGLGDLFSVRVAGNVIGPIELDTVEYAALYLDAALVLVLGHERCGAVTAVLEGNTKDIKSIAKLIEPAVKIAKKEEGNTLENCIKENVKLVVEKLKKKKALASLIKKEKLKVIGGYYDLDTGHVTIIQE